GEALACKLPGRPRWRPPDWSAFRDDWKRLRDIAGKAKKVISEADRKARRAALKSERGSASHLVVEAGAKLGLERAESEAFHRAFVRRLSPARAVELVLAQKYKAISPSQMRRLVAEMRPRPVKWVVD